MTLKHNPLDSAEDPTAAPISASVPTPREKEARETAAGCRERANADLTRATSMDTVNGRKIFERSAASWSKRAEMLQRIETGIESRLADPRSQMLELTHSEISEDLACQNFDARAAADLTRPVRRKQEPSHD